jgi:hypothetical protein
MVASLIGFGKEYKVAEGLLFVLSPAHESGRQNHECDARDTILDDVTSVIIISFRSAHVPRLNLAFVAPNCGNLGRWRQQKTSITGTSFGEL